MSTHEFDPNCADCRPILIDPKTGKVLPPEHPAMVAINHVWETSTREVQEAFHRVTVKNSRDPKDLALMRSFTERLDQEPN